MPDLTNAVTYFEVFDMVASIDFYCGRLGFELVFASPEVETAEGRFPHFARVRRGAAELMLNTAYDSNERPPDRSEPRWAGCRYVCLYVDCDDVEALHAEFADRGLVVEPPAPTRYGYLAIEAADPDGHRIIFHRPVR